MRHIAAKISRNLQAKVIHGPLGEDKDASTSPGALGSPLTSPKPVPAPSPSRITTDSSATVNNKSGRVSNHIKMLKTRRKSKPQWIVGHRNLGELRTSFEEDQQKELEDLKGMQIVKNQLSNHWRANRLANRMFNRRVNNSRTKTSILLTGSEPDQEEVVEAMRNMNRFVIEKFLHTQSQNRRVLERLNSRHVRAISDIEVTKAKVRRLSDSSLHEVKIIEEEEKREKMEERRGVKRPYKRASMSSLLDLITAKTETLHNGKTSDKLHKLLERGVQSFRSKKESVSAAISKRVKSKKGRSKEKGGSRRRRRQRKEKENMAACDDDDEATSYKSSGTEEVDSATCTSPPFHSGLTLETLFETTTPVPAKESTESDEATSPLVSDCLLIVHTRNSNLFA